MTLSAQYSNPFDQQDIALDAVFTGPDDKQFKVAGFWDAKLGWLIRFSPSQVGQWCYSIITTDKVGGSEPYSGNFTTLTSARHGWVQSANNINSNYSARYLMHQDGSEFYGIGHGSLDCHVIRNLDTH